MKIHIKETNNNTYNLVIHFPVPTGNNSAKISWKDIGLKSKMIGSTCLDVGTKTSEITQIENDQITAGDVIEIATSISSGSELSDADIIKLADIMIDEFKAKMFRSLKYYGHTIN